MIRQPWKPPLETSQQGQSIMTSNSDLHVEPADAPDRGQHVETVAKEDLEMDDITSALATTSLGLVPPSVTRKQKKRDSAAHTGQAANGIDSVGREMMQKS